ncbi:hypothetical protein [Pseudanabaena sp. BC1403]|uniref:hypothetical protein n=1 Tax=Pseudanabaena sp. BC1403 TaxID=2043171 RepID=UPI000CD9DC1A|nr:hypothetical protein [Pseudanabaena sp. BC1403]
MSEQEQAIIQLNNQVSDINARLRVIENLLTSHQQISNAKQKAIPKIERHYTTVNEGWYSENSGIVL